MAQAGKKMGGSHTGKPGPKGAGQTNDEDFGRVDLAQREKGDNKLQADDQVKVRNERKDQPDARRTADHSINESFDKMDKDVRAREELGKKRD